jgi:hypothetical protein
MNHVTPQLVELNVDSMWLPIRSDWELPFSIDARISGLPPATTLVAQGRIRKNGRQFLVRRTIPDIDFAFVAAPSLQRVTAGALELFSADLGSDSAKHYRLHGSGSLTFLQSLLGPLPSSPVRVVMVRREQDAGYARAGYVVLTEGKRSDETGAAKFIAHEFGHAWFRHGNSMTEDRWIKESFAEYVSLRYVEAALGVAARDKIVGQLRERLKGDGPILGRGRPGYVETYIKGPLLLSTLEEEVGREGMSQFVKLVATREASDTAAVLAILAEAAGAETASRFETALRK